jgi:serine/threonine protein kinase
MLGAKDPTLWSLVEQEELERPSELKTLKDRTIYLSRRLTETQWVGDPTITNFSEARFGKLGEMYRGKVMPDRYQAPEVILGMEWGSKIDMWSLGLMVCRTTAGSFCDKLLTRG